MDLFENIGIGMIKKPDIGISIKRNPDIGIGMNPHQGIGIGIRASVEHYQVRYFTNTDIELK